MEIFGDQAQVHSIVRSDGTPEDDANAVRTLTNRLVGAVYKPDRFDPYLDDELYVDDVLREEELTLLREIAGRIERGYK